MYWAVMVLLAALAWVPLWVVLSIGGDGMGATRLGRLARRLRGRPSEPADNGRRPLEEVVDDLRRRHDRLRSLDPRASFVKVEAAQAAYDRVLAECCVLLGLPHLLDVLASGRERDAERTRVEVALSGCGVDWPHAA